MNLDSARALFPLVTAAGLRGLERIRQHSGAPRWTHLIGDHVEAGDLAAVEAYRQALVTPPPARGPPPWVVEWVARRRARVPLWRQRIPEGYALERDWVHLPTSSREDVAARIEGLVPEDEPLERLIVYETSGTTGHALRVPHHPRAVALTHVLAERALSWHGRVVRQEAGTVACLNLRAQASLWVYPSLFSVWGQAGFARVNLAMSSWPGGVEAARRFVGELAPGFLSGDPASFAELLRLDLPARPAALLSTAVALSGPLREALAERYGCPVIDWYSTTETGPVACTAPGETAMALLAPDLYVEVIDAAGHPVAEGERGEIAVTGGRNPYLPLLRYRTGDHARLGRAAGAGGTLEPRLLDLEGRAAVTFRAEDGSPVSPVDVGRALRHHFAVVQHAFEQRADRSCLAVLRPARGIPVDAEQVEAELRALFGPGIPVEVRIDPDLGGGGKVVPYRSALSGEESAA